MKALTNLPLIICCVAITLIFGFIPLTASNQGTQPKIEKKEQCNLTVKELKFAEVKKPSEEMLKELKKLEKDVKKFSKSMSLLKTEIAYHKSSFSDYDSTSVRPDSSNLFVKKKSWLRRAIDRIGLR
jgi:hypothetical protein